MKKNNTSSHPIFLNHERIKKEGIVVLNNVRGVPTGDAPFNSSDYVICLCQRGKMHVKLDDYNDVSEKYVVAVIFPNHSVLKVRATDDYLATLIVANASVLNDPMLQIIRQLRYKYERHPSVKLNKRQFKIMINLVDVMQETSNNDIPDKHTMMVRQLECLLRFLNLYRNQNLNESDDGKRISSQFYSNLKQYAHQHHDVEFYAKLLFLSPKHFSTVIKHETGHAAAYWIHNHIVAEARMLLHLRHDITIQAIAEMLGFDDQATFSRYFKREAGMSPTEFREKKK